MAKSARHRAREFALQGLYQWSLTGNPLSAIEQHLSEVSGFERIDQALFLEVLRGAVAERDLLVGNLSPVLDRDMDDVSPVEAAILLIAAFELKHCPATPYRVVINEAIELAKDFGGSEGHRYVNGVLDKLASTLRADEVAARPRAPAKQKSL